MSESVYKSVRAGISMENALITNITVSSGRSLLLLWWIASALAVWLLGVLLRTLTVRRLLARIWRLTWWWRWRSRVILLPIAAGRG